MREEIPNSLTETHDLSSSTWWQKQIAKFVKIRQGNQNIDAPQTTDDMSLQAVQLHIARGNVTEAKIILSKSPLKDNPQLNTLREAVLEYTELHGRLNKALQLYLKASLANQNS